MKKVVLLLILILGISACTSPGAQSQPDSDLAPVSAEAAKPLEILQSTYSELNKKSLGGIHPIDMMVEEPWLELANDIFCLHQSHETFKLDDTRFVYCGSVHDIGEKQKPQYADGGGNSYAGLHSGMLFTEAQEVMGRECSCVAMEDGPFFCVISAPVLKVNENFTIYANLISYDHIGKNSHLILSRNCLDGSHDR